MPSTRFIAGFAGRYNVVAVVSVSRAETDRLLATVEGYRDAIRKRLRAWVATGEESRHAFLALESTASAFPRRCSIPARFS